MSTEESATPKETQKSKAKLTVKKKASASSTAEFSVTAVRKKVSVSDEISEMQPVKRKKTSSPEQEETAKPLKRKQPSEEPKEEDTQKPLKRKSSSSQEETAAKPVRKKHASSEEDGTEKPVRKKRPSSEEDSTAKPVRKKRPSSEGDGTEKPVRKKHASQKAKKNPDAPAKKSEDEPEQLKKTKLQLTNSGKAILAVLSASVVIFCVVMIVKISHQNVEEINAKHMTTAEAAGLYAESETLAPETTEEPTTETETETESETLPLATLAPSLQNSKYTPFIDYSYPVDPDRPMVALTFDDGPAEGSSDDILDVLEQYNAHATFFIVGKCVTPDTKRILQRELELGCELGNHTYEHLSLRDELDLEGGIDAIQTCDDKIYNATGRYPMHIRPPYGAYTDELREEEKRPFIYWSLDSNDWKWLDAQTDYDVVMDNVSDGDIILMHDIHQASADATKMIVPALINKGYQLVTVSELMYYRHLDEKESMLVFNVHPDEPYYELLHEEETTEAQEDDEETNETDEDNEDDTDKDNSTDDEKDEDGED